MAIILLNGPTECGKGIAYTLIRAVYGAGDGRVKKRLHELASCIFQVPEALWEEREGKETPNPLLTVSTNEYYKLRKHIKLRQYDYELGNPEYSIRLTPREALIYVSEVFAKPLFGQDYFGRERLKLIAAPGLYVCDSTGFNAELEGLNPADTMIIQVIGRGKFSTSDTRGYVHLPGAYSVTINNAGTVQEYLGDIERTVDQWVTTLPASVHPDFGRCGAAKLEAESRMPPVSILPGGV